MDPQDAETADSLILIQLAQAGEHEALERLFEGFYPRLHRMTRARLGPEIRRYADSGDVLQEVLYDAIRDFERFDIRSSPASWLS